MHRSHWKGYLPFVKAKFILCFCNANSPEKDYENDEVIVYDNTNFDHVG